MDQPSGDADPRLVRIEGGQGFVVGDHARVEMHVHQAIRPRSPRGPARTIQEFDPAELGVHRAIHLEQHFGSPDLTPYIRRPHDEQVVSALTGKYRAATLVVLVGGSSTGKTRACYEAILSARPDSPLLAPEDPDELVAVLDDGVPADAVLWLDDLQRYVNGLDGEVVARGLRRLLAGRSQQDAGLVVIGSMWPQWWLTLTRMPAEGLSDEHPAARSLLGLAAKISVAEDFSELASQNRDYLSERVAIDGRLRTALEAGGPTKRISQVLAGGPLLVDRFTTLLDERAAAVLVAAMDAARLGFDSPLPTTMLEQAAAGYLSPELRVAPEGWFDRALADAAEVVHGIRALTPIRSSAGVGPPDGYRLHDYLLQYATRSRRRTPIPARLWESLVAHTTNRDDASRIAENAQNRLLYRYAVPLLRLNADAGDERSAQRLAILLAQQGDAEALQARADRGDSWSAHQLVHVLAGLGDLEGLRTNAEAGNTYAAGFVTDLLAEWGDLEGLKVRSDAGDRRARKHYVDLLVARGDLAKLRVEAGNGNQRAQVHLVRVLVSRGDVAELTSLVRRGDTRAASGLVEVLARNEDVAGLRARAEAGDTEAAARLVDLLARMGSLAGLTGYAQSGNDAASWEAARLLVDHGDLDELRARAERGNLAARRYLISFLRSWDDKDGLRYWAAQGDLDAVHGLAELLTEDGQHVAAVAVLTDALSPTSRLAAEEIVTRLERSPSFDPRAFDGYPKADVGILNAIHRVLHRSGALPQPSAPPQRRDDQQTGTGAFVTRPSMPLVPTRAIVAAMITQGDLAGLRRLANAGNPQAAAGVVDVLATRGDEDGLRRHADDGDSRAAALLADLFARRGDLSAIRERVDKGDIPAVERLVREFVAAEDVQALRTLADAGHVQAAVGLANLLLRRQDMAGLRLETNAGNVFASNHLMHLMVVRRPDLADQLRRQGLHADELPA